MVRALNRLIPPTFCRKPHVRLRAFGGSSVTASTFAALKRRLVEHRRVELLIDIWVFLDVRGCWKSTIYKCETLILISDILTLILTFYGEYLETS